MREEIAIEQLRNVIGDVQLTKSEEGTLNWLASFEDVNADIISIIRKSKKTKEIVPVTEKREVWVITVFFTEESGIRNYDEYTANSYDDIPKVINQIHQDYDPEDIEEIIVGDEPEIMEFFTFRK